MRQQAEKQPVQAAGEVPTDGREHAALRLRGLHYSPGGDGGGMDRAAVRGPVTALTVGARRHGRGRPLFPSVHVSRSQTLHICFFSFLLLLPPLSLCLSFSASLHVLLSPRKSVVWPLRELPLPSNCITPINTQNKSLCIYENSKKIYTVI